MRVEQSSEPIVGWRVWNLSEDGIGPVLRAATSDTGDGWPRRRPFEATCAVPRFLPGLRPRHEAPDPGCRCGIYASTSLAIVDRHRPAWPPATVIGRVALWGRTIAHEHGWRARFAYPDRLRLCCIVCAWLEPGPGEPTVVHSFRRNLYALCDEHAGGIELPGGRRTQPVATTAKELRDRLLDAYAVDLLPAEPLEGLYRRPPAPEVPGFIPSIRVLPSR
jgi:hypothetical protein